MQRPDIWTCEQPRLHAMTQGASVPVMDALPPTGVVVVARLDGRRMPHTDGVFTEFYDKLLLPSHFGWNWAALSDCLRDLQWMPASRYLLVMENAESVLAGHPEEREVLLRILVQAAETWSNSSDGPGNAGVPFNALFCCSEDEASKVADEIMRVQDGHA